MWKRRMRPRRWGVNIICFTADGHVYFDLKYNKVTLNFYNLTKKLFIFTVNTGIDQNQ